MAQPTLRRLDVLALKNRSASDIGQIPAAASVDVYYQGATVSQAITIPAHSADNFAQVYDSGRLRVGDTVVLGPGGGTVTVAEVNLTQVNLSNTSASAYTVAVGTRLLITNRRPPIYAGPLSSGPSISNPFTTDAATGRGSAYVAETRFDYVVSGSGLVPRVFADAEGNIVSSPFGWANIVDFPSVQDAVNSLPLGGGVVYVPPGTYDPTTIPAFVPPLILPNKPIQLLGDGPQISRLSYGGGAGYTPDPNLDLIQLTGNYQTVQGLTLIGAGVAGAGAGIRILGAPDISGHLVYRSRIADCLISGTSSWGIRVDDQVVNGSQMFAVWGLYENVELTNCRNGGCIYVGGPGTTTQFFRACRLHDYQGCGVYAAHNVTLSFTDCEISNKWLSGSGEITESVLIDSCDNVFFSGCRFSAFKFRFVPFIKAVGTYRGLTVEACTFDQQLLSDYSADGVGSRNWLTAVHLAGWGRGVLVINPYLTLPGGDASLGNRSVFIDTPITPDKPIESIILGGAVTDSTSSTHQRTQRFRLLTGLRAQSCSTVPGVPVSRG